MARLSQIDTVAWRDLVPLTFGERFWELSLGLPWLVLSLWCYVHGWWLAGLACSFYVFLTGLLFHAEHHLFPAVPTAHLPELARRLDAVIPAVCQRQVLSLHAIHSGTSQAGASSL